MDFNELEKIRQALYPKRWEDQEGGPNIIEVSRKDLKANVLPRENEN